MLSPKIEEALNKQIGIEADSSNFYLAMSSWCDQSGLPGSAKFLMNHSEEERGHMMRLFHYINEAGGKAIVPASKQPPGEFNSLKGVFEKVLEHEKFVTNSINELVGVCMAEQDYSTFNFLQWYVGEQHEEEKLIRSILDMINITGDKEAGLFIADSEIEKRIQNPDTAAN